MRRKHHRMLLRENLKDLETDFRSLQQQGWELDPEFKDSDTLPDIFAKLYGPVPEGGGKIKCTIGIGMVKYEEVDLEAENAQLRAKVNELEAKLQGQPSA